MSRPLTQIGLYARRSAVLCVVLTIVAMVSAGSGFGPSASSGSATKFVVALLHAPLFLLDFAAPFFDRNPALFFVTAAMLQILHFLVIAVAVRAIVKSVRSKRRTDAR